MDIQAIEKAASKIQNSLFRKASANALGAFRSQFKGSGLQFREHQIYTPGDDVRFIDWKLSARLQKTYVKTFEEERNVEIVAFIDWSPSLSMGFKKVSKYQAALEMTCLLGLLAQKTKDLVKVVVLCDPLIETPFLSGKELITYLTVQLDRAGHLGKDKILNRELEAKELSVEQKIRLMLSYTQRKKEVTLFSDFYEYAADELKKLSSKRHMHLFRLMIPLDYADVMPFSLWGKFSGSKFYFPRMKMSDSKGDWNSTLKQKIHDVDLSKGHLDQLVRVMA